MVTGTTWTNSLTYNAGDGLYYDTLGASYSVDTTTGNYIETSTGKLVDNNGHYISGSGIKITTITGVTYQLILGSVGLLGPLIYSIATKSNPLKGFVLVLAGTLLGIGVGYTIDKSVKSST